eukprot:6199593-Pleurochrysis_carterae.AAC.2
MYNDHNLADGARVLRAIPHAAVRRAASEAMHCIWLHVRPRSISGCSCLGGNAANRDRFEGRRLKSGQIALIEVVDGACGDARERPVRQARAAQAHTESNMEKHILNSLHLAKFGLLKTLWKCGIMNNASDDARAAISKQLNE